MRDPSDRIRARVDGWRRLADVAGDDVRQLVPRTSTCPSCAADLDAHVQAAALAEAVDGRARASPRRAWCSTGPRT